VLFKSLIRAVSVTMSVLDSLRLANLSLLVLMSDFKR